MARSERIYRTPETNATMNSGMLRLIARRRYCRVIRACAMHTHDGEVESDGYEQPAQLEMHPDIRAWCFMPGGTSNLVRNAVRRRVLGERTIRQQVQRRQLELLALLVNSVAPLAYQRPQVRDGMQAQKLWDLVLGDLASPVSWPVHIGLVDGALGQEVHRDHT